MKRFNLSYHSAIFLAFDVYIAAKKPASDRYTSFINILIAKRSINEGIQHLVQELYSAALEYNQALNHINSSRRAIDHTAQLFSLVIYTLFCYAVYSAHMPWSCLFDE